jgi:hypothetical protein
LDVKEEQVPAEALSAQRPETPVLTNGNTSINLSPDVELLGEKAKQVIINDDLICSHGKFSNL